MGKQFQHFVLEIPPFFWFLVFEVGKFVRQQFGSVRNHLIKICTLGPTAQKIEKEKDWQKKNRI
jgi:hypothetical protein